MECDDLVHGEQILNHYNNKKARELLMKTKDFCININNFENELRSLASIKKVDDYGMFQMTYFGDYGFDDFLKVGAKNDSELERHVSERVYRGMPIKLNLAGGGCTVFAARNAAGEVIFARNYDFPLYSPPLQLITRPDNGYASVSTVSLLYMDYDANYLPSGPNSDSFATLAAPYIPADGVNEKGVAIALLAVPEAKPPFCENKITLNTTTAVRLVLDKAASVNEAVELLRQYNIFFSCNISCHFLIADVSGRSVLVSYWDDDLKVTETNDPFQIASNFIAYNDLNIGYGACEFDRYNQVKVALESSGGTLNETQVIDLLAKVGVASPEASEEWSTIYNSSSSELHAGLQWSTIYNLSTLKGTIFANRNSDNLINFSIT